MNRGLAALFETCATRHADRVAIEDPARGTNLRYAELEAASAVVRRALEGLGVGPGTRVGVSGKSIPVVATILGTLRAGAAYVPVDKGAPAARSASILADCGVRAFVTETDHAAELRQALASEGVVVEDPVALLDDAHGPALVLCVCQPAAASQPPPEGLAYVLYTSGSTGKPKGVAHTHASALAFLAWCSEEFRPTPEDRFSSHAPFHFDLSILDLYVPLHHGATLVLIEDDLGKSPTGLAELLHAGITVWYSTPSILRLILDYGKLDPARCDALRIVCFAGEVFPIPHLRRLRELLPDPRYYNLYGPTETNVCTAYALPPAPDAERETPYPIGSLCSDDMARIVDEHDHDVAEGERGELCIAGGSVMSGYWNLPERTREAFLIDGNETAWYRTGDVVFVDEEGQFVYVGRRDRMIKRRGYRIEPGEIEAALYAHEEVSEVAVLDRPTDEGTEIHAVLATRSGEPLSLIALKRWCADHLPLYMVPDRFHFHEVLPKTSTDKIDYQALRGTLACTSS